MLRGGARILTSTFRSVLTALNQWAEEEPPARIQERVANLTLYSTSRRQVKAVPREAPGKDLGETAGSRKRETNRSASACNQPSNERSGQ